MLSSIFMYSAMFGGIFLLLQLLMTFVGGDHGGDSGHFDGGFDGDADIGGDGHDAGDLSAAHQDVGSMFFEVFSLRTIAAAATFFGLVGMAVLHSGGSEFQATASGVVAGLVALYALYWVFKQLYRLQASGNQDIHNALGSAAQVYVPIPRANSGRGKVQFEMQGRIVEYQAVTDDDQKIGTGDSVFIEAIVDTDTVLVSRAVTVSTAEKSE